MRFFAFLCCFVLFGCSDDQRTDHGGTGGSGGDTGSDPGGGGSGGGNVTGGGGSFVVPGGWGLPALEEQITNGFPNTPDELASCVPYDPSDTEADDGGFARVVFGPFVRDWIAEFPRWLAANDEQHMTPKSWWITWTRASSLEEAAEKPCSGAINGVDVYTSQPVNGVSVIEAHNFLKHTYYQGEVVVLCVQHDSDVLGWGRATGIMMCGDPGSSTERDSWESNGESIPLGEHTGTPYYSRRWAFEMPEVEPY